MLYISELCEDCAVANEIDYEIDDAWTNIHGIYDNGPCDHGVWRLTLTAYSHYFREKYDQNDWDHNSTPIILPHMKVGDGTISYWRGAGHAHARVHKILELPTKFLGRSGQLFWGPSGCHHQLPAGHVQALGRTVQGILVLLVVPVGSLGQLPQVKGHKASREWNGKLWWEKSGKERRNSQLDLLIC